MRRRRSRAARARARRAARARCAQRARHGVEPGPGHPAIPCSALDAAVTSSEPPSERPRLKLAPRSAAAASSGPAKSSIFGGARTREEILAAKGVDVKKKEAELDAKARPKRLTKQQAEELAAAEAEIKFEQDKLANATTPGEKAVAQSKVK